MVLNIVIFLWAKRLIVPLIEKKGVYDLYSAKANVKDQYYV